jgi:hypothetical protein
MKKKKNIQFKTSMFIRKNLRIIETIQIAIFFMFEILQNFIIAGNHEFQIRSIVKLVLFILSF